MKARHALLDHFRLSHGEAQNALIDSLLAGRVSRRAFMRHGSRLGLSLATLSTIAGSAGFLAEPRLARAAGGGTVRVAQFVPASASTRSRWPMAAGSLSCPRSAIPVLRPQ